jgi:hypothetical protein
MQVPLDVGLSYRERIEMRDKLLAAVGLGMAAPTAAQRLWLLGCTVAPLAKVLVWLGTCPAIATEHAAELLEAMFLADALRDAPELLPLFD